MCYDAYVEANRHVAAADVVFTGDSITQFWYSADPDFFESNGFICRGIAAQTSLGVLARFRQDVVALNPKVVVILAGINDIAGNDGKMGMNNTMLEMSAAVQAGYWHLFRYDPRRLEKGRNPFQLDSPAPIMDYQEFLSGEVRYSSLQLTFPERAKELFARAEKQAQEKYQRLVDLSRPWEQKQN